MFQILYTGEAKERLREIAKFDLIKKLPQTYSSDPFLKGEHFKGLKRNRIGRYRFIYRVLENDKEIHIITIDLRKSVYD